MNSVINLQLWQMIAAYIFVLIVMLIVKTKGIPREKEILISSVRMTIQLILTGYILVYLFNTPSLSHSFAEPVALIRLTQRSTTVVTRSYSRQISDLDLPALYSWTIWCLNSSLKDRRCLLSLMLLISFSF